MSAAATSVRKNSSSSTLDIISEMLESQPNESSLQHYKTRLSQACFQAFFTNFQESARPAKVSLSASGEITLDEENCPHYVQTVVRKASSLYKQFAEKYGNEMIALYGRQNYSTIAEGATTMLQYTLKHHELQVQFRKEEKILDNNFIKETGTNPNKKSHFSHALAIAKIKEKEIIKFYQESKKLFDEFRRKIFEELEKKEGRTPLTPQQQADKAFAELFKNEKTVKKKKTKTQSSSSSEGIKPADPTPSSGSSSSSSTSAPSLPTPTLFHIHPRVSRWKTQDPNTIKQFKDFQGGQTVLQYEKMSDKEIEHQRRCHYMPGIEMILSNPVNKNIYYFQTDRGYGLMAELIPSDHTPSSLGVVYVGVGEGNNIFHAMFEEGLVGKNVQQIFQAASVPAVEPSSDEEFTPVGRFPLHQNTDKTLELRYTDSHTLKIYPLM